MKQEWKFSCKKDFEELMLAILRPLIPFYSEGKAQVELGATAAVYDKKAAGAEGFARPLWALVPYWAGGGEQEEFGPLYARGLAAGTNPDSQDYWGGFQDIDQRFVEMAALAYGLLFTPEVLWDPLSKREQDQVANWLYEINHYKLPPCNWLFFKILVNLALKARKKRYSETGIKESMDYIESCYEGNGWYVDGQNGQKDYYISFAFHYYSLIYLRLMQQEDPKQCRIYQERACIFAKEFITWFAKDGSAVAYGRSLTYRFAQVSFFSMCVAAEVETLPFPVMKGLIERHLQFWMKQPIFDHADLLTIGYGYPNLLMSEQYNAPGSPYWAMKAFAFLSLPKEHPFWSMEAAPLPEWKEPRVISNGDMLMQKINGHIYAYVTGRKMAHQHVHTEEKYSKFVYSSQYAFSVSRSLYSLEEAAPDYMLAFAYDNRIHVKERTKKSSMKDGKLVIQWLAGKAVQVETKIQIISGGHKRIHNIRSTIACEAYDCGWAIPKEGTDMDICTNKNGDAANQIKLVRNGSAYFVKGNGEPAAIYASPNTNLLYSQTWIPCMKYQIYPGEQIIETEFTESVLAED